MAGLAYSSEPLEPAGRYYSLQSDSIAGTIPAASGGGAGGAGTIVKLDRTCRSVQCVTERRDGGDRPRNFGGGGVDGLAYSSKPLEPADPYYSIQSDPIAGTVPAALVEAVWLGWHIRQNRSNLQVGTIRCRATRSRGLSPQLRGAV